MQEAVPRFHTEKEDIGIGERIALLRQMTETRTLQKIALPTHNGYLLASVGDILRCEADGSYTGIFREEEGSLLVSRRLGYFEQALRQADFLRVHHSHLVNLGKICRYTKGRGGLLELVDGSQVPVSEKMKKPLLQRLKEGI